MDPNNNFNYGLGSDLPTQMGTFNENAPFVEMSSSGNWLQRLLNPGIAEDVQFRQNMFSLNKNLEWQEYMYNKYNSPEAMVKQYEAAGLNPNMINNVSSSASASPASASGSSSAISSGEGLLGHIMNLGEKITNPISSIFSTIGQSIANKQARKMNPLLFKQVQTTIDKLSADIDFTKVQKKSMEAVLPTLYEKAVADKNLVIQNIENLKKQVELYDEQKKNISEDTSLKIAQTGEVKERERNLFEDRMKKEFERSFRELFGIDISQGNISMLVQAILKGHGDQIITALSDFVTSALGAIPKAVGNIGKGIFDIPENIGLNSYLNSGFNPFNVGKKLGTMMRNAFKAPLNSGIDLDNYPDF